MAWGSTQLPVVVVSLAVLVAGSARAGSLETCIGDCDGSGAVSIAELLTGVNIALDRAAVASCPGFDLNQSGSLQINELLGAVRSAIEGCTSPDPTPTPTPEDFVAVAGDFACLTEWTRIRHFRITNLAGHLDEALAIARGEMPPPYPLGTIIQLVPTEAMVKRGPGFFPAGNDWEFFALRASTGRTEIVQRGREEVVNIGPPCFGCHSAAADHDFICESGRGCIELGLSEVLIDALQNSDPRCASP